MPLSTRNSRIVSALFSGYSFILVNQKELIFSFRWKKSEICSWTLFTWICFQCTYTVVRFQIIKGLDLWRPFEPKFQVNSSSVNTTEISMGSERRFSHIGSNPKWSFGVNSFIRSNYCSFASQSVPVLAKFSSLDVLNYCSFASQSVPVLAKLSSLDSWTEGVDCVLVIGRLIILKFDHLHR